MTTTHAERAALCPNGAEHTDCPPGYLEWHAWAEEMGKTHVSTRCPSCDRFAIWVPLPEGETAFAASLRPDRMFLRQWRESYQAKVREHVGPEAIDMAISVPGAFYILTVLRERIVCATTDEHLRVLDMGTGFSTMCIREWALGADVEEGLVYTGRDHNPDWLAWVRREFLLGADPEALKTWLRGGQAHDTFTVGLIDRTEQKEYDVIIVDHGPQLQTRADDVPWLVSQLAPEGIMLFDDWRPKHEGRIRRALAAVGGNWEIGMGPDTKRTLRDKGIGYAWRA